MSDRVTIEFETQPHGGTVADVRLNRPDKLNALDYTMFEALISTGQKLNEDESVRCVVLSGEGRAFCAGLDFASFMAMGGEGGGPAEALLARDGIANRAQLACHVWNDLRVPVVAAIAGEAFGGGLQLALGADIRIVGPTARMSVMEIKWGLVPDMTGTQTLRHLLRLDIAKELTFSGRVVESEEAVRIGLATRQAGDPLAEAMVLARAIAGRSPDAIRGAKRLLNEAPYVSLEEGLLREEQAQMKLLGSANQMEAVMANMQKRPPKFE